MKHPMIAAAALLILLGPPGMHAQPGPEGTGPGRAYRGRGVGPEQIHERLNLTQDQEKQMQRLRLDHQKKMQQVHSKVAEARLDLEALFLAEAPDRSAIEKATTAIADLRRQQQMNRVDHWFAVNAILTPTQREVWKEIAQKPPRPVFRGTGCRGRHCCGGWED